MVLPFLKKKESHPLEAFLENSFRCSKCSRMISLDGFSPLEMGRCPKCDTPNFIPMRINKFWLFYPLGGGGMGAVYKSYHEDYPNTFYAVKVLPRGRQDSPELISNLQSEADTISKLGTHPCIVGGIEFGEERGEYYLATDFIKGERLDKRISRHGKLPEIEVLLHALRILSAETHIFNQGFLFRDLKPENVMVTKEDGAYLFDYGICIRVEDGVNGGDEIIEGSPFYMPPERISGSGEGPYSEIYSLGMILYEALTGKTYFSAKELKVLARQLMREYRLMNVEGKMKNISPDVATIIDKMIKRVPEERYQTFVEVERDIFKIFTDRLLKGSR